MFPFTQTVCDQTVVSCLRLFATELHANETKALYPSGIVNRAKHARSRKLPAARRHDTREEIVARVPIFWLVSFWGCIYLPFLLLLAFVVQLTKLFLIVS